MPDLGLFTGLTVLDAAAVAGLVLAWAFATRIIEHPPKGHPSTSVLMAEYRREWMVHFVHRQPRIFDSQIVANLRQGTAFFASASMIAIGGGFALLGNADQLRGVAADLTESADPVVVFEIKLMLMLLFAANAFLKFVWSHRLFGYTSVLMAAVPDDASNPITLPRARKAAEINITGARSYNRGLRSVYFGIAASVWLAGAVPLMVATVITLAVILRREFASVSRAVLLEPTDHNTAS
ncbi:DUF599 domain-containing protein [Sagittula sp. SSi028]|uniref:DUF599 domain-containing protein n=1 Tax=Sagittula sp. SSi028 TaxID=3400636 RepID=UPI003AF714F3